MNAVTVELNERCLTLSNYQVIARCHMPFMHSKGAINYIDTDHQTLQTLLIVLLLISLNVISITDETVCMSLI